MVEQVDKTSVANLKSMFESKVNVKSEVVNKDNAAAPKKLDTSWLDQGTRPSAMSHAVPSSSIKKIDHSKLFAPQNQQ